MSQIIVFQSLSSCGATSFVLNMGIGIHQVWKDKKVLLVSAGIRNDLCIYCAKKVQKKGMGYVCAGIDINDFGVEEDMFNKYDYILVDLDRSPSLSEHQFWYERMDIHIKVISLLPSCFQHFKTFEEIQKNSQPLHYTFLNNVRGLTQNKAFEYAQSNDCEADFVFTHDPKPFWKQVFTGVPVMDQKHSKWGSQLLDFINKNILHEKS